VIRVTDSDSRHGDGIPRRSVVQAGALGIGGLLLPDLLRARAAQASVDPQRAAEKTAVILFWCCGGPGHMETWDPKPEAPAEYRGPFGAINSNVDGIQLGELMPEQAKIMDRLAIVRTVHHSSGDHTRANHWMLTGFEGPDDNDTDAGPAQRNPSMGSATARLRGPNRPGMPPYVAIPHLRGTENFFHYHAYAGSSYNPFNIDSDPNEKSYAVRDLNPAPGLTLGRLQNRRAFLEKFDRFRAAADRALAERDGAYQRAFDMLTGPEAHAAFDLSTEPAALRDRYGRHTFGQSALLARRLVEAGVTFVTVNCVPWDHHGTPQLKTEEGAKLLIPHLDRALASLVRDLVDRGLFDRTLVVAMGEFGRTPKMNENGGRDHWGDTFSVLFANGRMRMGQAIGKSSARGEYPLDRPTTPQDVLATVYQHLGIDPHAVTFEDRTGRPVYLLDGGQAIRELTG